VSEDAAIGSSVFTVEARDLDLDSNGKVTYLLEMTSADVGHFVIDDVTGVITIARYVVVNKTQN